MDPIKLHRPQRLALRHAIDALVEKWKAMPNIDRTTAEEFRSLRHDVIASVKDLLGEECLLGPEESDLLDWAHGAPDYLHTLAMRKVVKALDVSEQRACKPAPDEPSGG